MLSGLFVHLVGFPCASEVSQVFAPSALSGLPAFQATAGKCRKLSGVIGNGRKLQEAVSSDGRRGC
eukprot:3841605-Alexandrium_andersonii.AAC.1